MCNKSRDNLGGNSDLDSDSTTVELFDLGISTVTDRNESVMSLHTTRLFYLMVATIYRRRFTTAEYDVAVLRRHHDTVLPCSCANMPDTAKLNVSLVCLHAPEYSGMRTTIASVRRLRDSQAHDIVTQVATTENQSKIRMMWVAAYLGTTTEGIIQGPRDIHSLIHSITLLTNRSPSSPGSSRPGGYYTRVQVHTCSAVSFSEIVPPTCAL